MIGRFIRRLCHRITNIFVWIPILWEDQDWDQDFLFRIMAFKAGRMAKYWKDPSKTFSLPGRAKKNYRDLKTIQGILERNTLKRPTPCEKQLDETWLEGSYLMFERDDGLVELIEDKEKTRNYSNWQSTSSKQSRHDWRLLMKLLDRRSKQWWD